MGGGGGKANSNAQAATGNEMEMFTKLAGLAMQQQNQRESTERGVINKMEPNPLFSKPLAAPSAGAAGTATFGGAPPTSGSGFPPVPNWYGPGPPPVPPPPPGK